MKYKTRKVRKVVSWEDCRDLCQQEGDCQYFRWKVNHLFSNLFQINSLEDNTKTWRRLCYLIKMQQVKSGRWVSGKKLCVSQDGKQCFVSHQALYIQLRVRKIKKTVTWMSCQDHCRDDKDCVFFRWKVRNYKCSFY